MNLSFISKFRTELMGIAMLLVVWHHLPMNINFSVYDFLKTNGGFGVDIFLLLSGMGLYFSTSKGLDIKKYAIKRAIRIFPIYSLIIVVLSIIKGGGYDITNIILKITTIGWWTGHGAYDWFIPNLVLLYILYPFYYLCLKPHKYGFYLGIIIVIGLYLYIFFLPYGSSFQSLYRYPVFFLGAIVGKLLKENVKEKKIDYFFLLLFCIGCGLSIYAYHKYNEPNLDPFIVPVIKLNGWLFIPYIFIVTGFCIITSYLLSLKKMDNINKLLKLIGSMSLEVYLLHGQFINLTRYITNTYNLSKPLIGIVLVSLSFIVAYWVHLLNIKIMDQLKSKLLN